MPPRSEKIRHHAPRAPVPGAHRPLQRRGTRRALAALAALAVSGHASIALAADETAPRAEPKTEGSPALWGSGIGVLATGWAASTFVYFVSTFHATKCMSFASDPQPDIDACEGARDDEQVAAVPMLVPVVGPFIAAGTLPEHGEGALTGSLLAIGVVETAGLVMIIAGLARRHEVPATGTQAGVTVVPRMGPGHAGVSVRGAF